MTQPGPGLMVVADAHPLERLGLISVLRQSFGCESIETADSVDDLVRSISPGVALVLIDHDLPGLRDLAPIQKLRRDHPATRFVIVSAACSFDLVFEAVRCGAHGFVPKTLGALEMAEAFRLVMAGLIYVPCQISEAPVPKAAAAFEPLTLARNLSERQRQVVRLACEGLSNKEIARELTISEATVKVHIGAAFRTLGVTNRARAIAAFHRYNQAPAAATIRSLEPALLVEDQAA